MPNYRPSCPALDGIARYTTAKLARDPIGSIIMEALESSNISAYISFKLQHSTRRKGGHMNSSILVQLAAKASMRVLKYSPTTVTNKTR
jgi:hypothetical protein